MSKMLSVASGFQYSVNIAYDLNNNEKLENFIPTQSALQLLEEIVLSTGASSTERARILIGAYGKGKSHIVLMILSILLKKELSLLKKALPKISENLKLYRCIKNYYESNNKILPVIIAGSSTSLTQAFIVALQRTLSENNLLNIMPDTNYHAAILVIERWRKDFYNTYESFEKLLDEPVASLISGLLNYNITAYKKFERLYPALTAGSSFNPFLGFDVVELYESVAKNLQSKGYSGICVVYDEFSKYLEANITEASVSDTKMLQDFAEKCNRCREPQMHLILISHKEIANYIDKLQKQKVDGWRGVSERFKHVRLSNNFLQTYEIIASVIQKDCTAWKSFTKRHSRDFKEITQKYGSHLLFSEGQKELETVVFGCYPLHPVSTFILPRLSERVAQNERTLFTFLSADASSALPSFLRQYNDECVEYITPDLIYNYFEPLFKKEVYSGAIYETYILTAKILLHLQENTLEAKIIKTISLFYMLSQFERLRPTRDEIINVFSASFDVYKINAAIDNLIKNELVVYLKRSNNFLRLKQSSGIDVWQKINDYIEANAGKASITKILNNANLDNFMYPSRYNDSREMTRFFTFTFIEENEVSFEAGLVAQNEENSADGVVFAIIPNSSESIPKLKKLLLKTSKNYELQIFIVPKQCTEIKRVIYEFEAVSYLRQEALGTPVLFDEYDVIYEDLRDVISVFITSYTQPEQYKSDYVYMGTQYAICRKAALTELMSDICDRVYSLTPVISNEALNKNIITNAASNSRKKLIAGLLCNQPENKLELMFTGQEASFMRSTLIRTGILSDKQGIQQINLAPSQYYIANMLHEVEAFVLSARTNKCVCFNALYTTLTSPKHHIGLRKGLIPIYLAVVFNKYWRQIVISDKLGPVKLTPDVLLQINTSPGSFTLSYIAWEREKEEFIARLAEVFSAFIVEAEKSINAYSFVANAIKRWAFALPKYAKESKQRPNGKRLEEQHIAMMKLLCSDISGYELLFEGLEKAFDNTSASAALAEKIKAAKAAYDSIIGELAKSLAEETKAMFMSNANAKNMAKMSLASVIKDWCDSLNSEVFDYLFQDGTERCLKHFKNVTNDEYLFITRLAQIETGLRIEDWGSATKSLFLSSLAGHKQTAQAFLTQADIIKQSSSKNYQISFVDGSGGVVTKKFERVKTSQRGKLLYNQVTKSLNAMGQSITEHEKRQILIDILSELC